MAAQSAAKTALQDLSRNPLAALGRRGIAVVDAVPGTRRTDLAGDLVAQAGGEAAPAVGTAPRRVAEPDYLAKSIVALPTRKPHSSPPNRSTSAVASERSVVR